MAKVSVKVTAPQLKKIGDAVTSTAFTSGLALAVIAEMRRFIRIGTSPVLGVRRFDAYKDPKKYPGDKKNQRPVNLELSGDMLNAITYKVLKDGIRIGIWDEEQRQKANTHMQGLNGVPQRKFMPIDPGDEFIVSIQRIIKALYAQKLSAILK